MAFNSIRNMFGETDFGGHEFGFGTPWENAQDASEAQEDWINRAAGERRRGYDKALNEWRTRFAPYEGFGGRRVAAWENLLKDPSSVTSTPGYQFRLGQGREALENSATARGGLLSGNALRGITEYGQNYATNEYDRALAREQAGAQFGATTDTNLSNALANLEVAKGGSDARQYEDLSKYAFWHEQQGMDQAQQWMGFLRGFLGGQSGGSDPDKTTTTQPTSQPAQPTGYSQNSFLSYNQPTYPNYVMDWNKYGGMNYGF